MKRYIVLIANIEDGKPSVKCFLFEIQNGKQLPVEEGCFKELDGHSPFRLNSFVMQDVRNGAESLNNKDKVCKPADEISGQDESEISQTPEADKRNPGECGLSIIPNIDDKHVSAGKKEIDDNGRKNKKNTEIDDHYHQNNTNMIKTTEGQHVDSLSAVTELENETNSGAAITESKSSIHHTHSPNEVRDIQQTTHTNTKQNNDNNSNNSNSNNYNSNNNNITINNGMNNNKSETESKVNNASAETVHKEGNDPGTEEVTTEHPTSSNDRSDPQHTTTTNGEEKEPTSTIEEPKELKVNDTPAESVDEGKNDPESKEAITELPTSPDHHSHPQPTATTNGEENESTSPSEEPQELKVNNASAEFAHEEGNDQETEEVSTGHPTSSNDRNVITGQPEASKHSSDPQHNTTTNEEEQTKEAKCTNLFCCIVLQRLQNLWRQSF